MAYLYLGLGTAQTWMTQEQVTQTIPLKIQRRCPNVRVTFDCTEFKCVSSASPTLHSEKLSKSCTDFIALIGRAPCGSITCASKLFTASISNKELTRQSGIMDLLKPGDELVADKFATGTASTGGCWSEIGNTTF